MGPQIDNATGTITIQRAKGCPESVSWEGTLTYPATPEGGGSELSEFYFFVGDSIQTLYTFENMSTEQQHDAEVTIQLTRTEKTASTTKSEQATIEVEWAAGKEGGATAIFKGSPDNLKTDDAGLDLKIFCN